LVFPVHSRNGSSTGYSELRSDVLSKHVLSNQPVFAFKDREGNDDHWTAHGLRRTVATYLRKMGTASEVVSGILNHISERAGVTEKHYDMDDQTATMRVALTGWQATLQDVSEGADPFGQSVEDVYAMERRLLEHRRGKLIAIAGGRA
jgi:hypothetical protein